MQVYSVLGILLSFVACVSFLRGLLLHCWLMSNLCGCWAVAYKPSHSMVGKKMESRYELEPCCPTCYLIELVCVSRFPSAVDVFLDFCGERLVLY